MSLLIVKKRCPFLAFIYPHTPLNLRQNVLKNNASRKPSLSILVEVQEIPRLLFSRHNKKF